MTIPALEGAAAPSPAPATVTARIAELDARLRAIVPGWRGLSVGRGDFAAAVAAAVAAAGSSRDEAADGPDRGPVGLGGAAGAEGILGGRARPVGRGLVAAGGVSVSSAAAFVHPLPGARLTQPFGPTELVLEPSGVVDFVPHAHVHDGLDLAAPLATPVRAAAAGEVIAAGRQADGAVVVRIRHADGSETRYGHLRDDLRVRVGDVVAAGATIGSVGLTGRTTGPHLHFELVVDGRTIDPAPRLAAAAPSGATCPNDAVVGEPAFDVTGTAAFDAVADGIPYAGEIREAAIRAGVDPLLLASLVRAESGFRADAVSSAGALGLTQLMPFNVRSMGVADPFDPAGNVAAGARYLANDLRLYERVDVALAAYHAGKGAVARAGGIPDSSTTRRYIDRVLGYWSGYLREAAARGVEVAA